MNEHWGRFGNGCRWWLLAALGMLLGACASIDYQPADVVIADAHGGGSALAIDSQSTRLASAGWSGDIRIWSLPEGTELAYWQAHAAEVTGMAFLGNGDRLLSAGLDGNLKEWSHRGGLFRVRATGSPITAMRADERNGLVITGHDDGSVRLWNLGDLSPNVRLGQQRGAVRAVAMQANGGLFASSATDGTVVLWRPNGPASELPRPGSDARTLAFSPDDGFLYGAGWFDLYRWNLRDRELRELPTEHHGIVNSIRFGADGAYLASISRQTDSAVLFIDPATGATLRRFQPHALCGAKVALSPDGKILATTSDDASVMIWKLETQGNTREGELPSPRKTKDPGL